MKFSLRDHIVSMLIAAGISLFIGAGIFCLIFFLREQTLTTAINGSALAGVVLLSAAILIILSRLGAFDLFAFGFRQMFHIHLSREIKTDYKYADYVKDKRTKRTKAKKYYFGIIFVALLFFIAVLVLEIIYHK